MKGTGPAVKEGEAPRVGAVGQVDPDASSRINRFVRGFGVVALVTSMLSAAVLMLYVRPLQRGFWLGTNPARVGANLQVQAVAAWLHAVSGWALAAVVVFLMAGAWRCTPWRRHGAALGAVALSLLLAYLVPWSSYLPWSDLSPDVLGFTLVSGGEGPFPELVGVRLGYPDLAPWPRGRAGEITLAVAHALALPAIAAGVWLARKIRARFVRARAGHP